MGNIAIEEFGPKVSDFFSPQEIEALKAEQVPSGVPVRFLYQGRNLNISNGRLMTKGVNIIYQVVYWNFLRETSKKIAQALGVEAIFDRG
jgi:hypothetical protein